MRTVLLMAVAVGLWSNAGQAGEDKRPTDQQKIQGTWVPVWQPETQPPKIVLKAVVFRGDKLTFVYEPGPGLSRDSIATTYKLDPTASPNAIDFTPLEGINKGKAHLGIYELKGDGLKIWYRGPGEDRPAAFVRLQRGFYAVLKRQIANAEQAVFKQQVPDKPLASGTVVQASDPPKEIQYKVKAFEESVQKSKVFSERLKKVIKGGAAFYGKPHIIGATQGSDELNQNMVMTFWLTNPNENPRNPTNRAFSISSGSSGSQWLMKVLLLAFEQKAEWVAVYVEPGDPDRPVYVAVYPRPEVGNRQLLPRR
jgi:uncharacterized protein (TIGR03067 family)